MGDPNVQNAHSSSELRAFTRQLLREVRAFDRMLLDGRFASGQPHIGAEQELAMVDANEQAAPIIQAVLAREAHPEIVSEITRFAVEFGTEPILWGDRALSTLENRLSHLLGIVRETVQAEGADVVMTGILPTLTLSDISHDAVTPEARYFAIDEAIQKLRGDEGFIQIRGVDELYLRHKGVLLEGCNTSFQTHFQVDPDAFPHYYNAAQMVAAPGPGGGGEQSAAVRAAAVARDAHRPVSNRPSTRGRATCTCANSARASTSAATGCTRA